ncbi:MAG: hypothetical protein HY809_02400 [Nitrospirae bacterium]|nr:hypothetical protein [Nitrospirota bacterium]
MSFIKKSTLLCFLSFFIAIFVFLKNAWVSEDAYIIFRSIEQLFAGNGPVWNPHERVQVFTSPLWFLVLATVRMFSKDVYLNAIVVSLILWIFTTITLKKIFRNNYMLLAAVLLFSASSGFFDFTSSGLENVLAYFIIAVYLLNYTNLFLLNEDNTFKRVSKEYLIKLILLLFGLIICIRHDLALLLLPPTFYVIYKNSGIFTIKKWVILSVAALLPFVLWSLFSLIYYGFIFPNTAYAKLNTGIHETVLFKEGIMYLFSSFRYDTLTLLVIIGCLGLSFFSYSKKHLAFLGYGVLLNLAYIVYVGGDFMQGRFLSYAYMVSVVLLLLTYEKIDFTKFKSLTFAFVCLYLVVYPHTPFNSPFDYANESIHLGITDERGYYFNDLSFYRYFIFNNKTGLHKAKLWANEGYKFKEAPDKIIVRMNIGLFGYYAGINKIIIDPFAISDPFLARLPVTGSWRIGHFKRKIPDGYVDSLIKGNESIVNPQLNEFYRKLKIITQNNELFTQERLKTIILFNMGIYNHLLPGDRNNLYGNSS